jgi:predicted  nucleic acid-binding Zn-ribbon protein
MQCLRDTRFNGPIKTGKRFRVAVASSLIAAVAATSTAHAIPVTDWGMNAQTAVIKAVQELKQYATQVQQWKQQIDQYVTQIEQFKTQIEELKTAATTLKNMTGSRFLGQVADAAGLKDLIPKDFQNAFTEMKSFGYWGLTPYARTLRDADQVFNCADLFKFSGDTTSNYWLMRRCERETGKTSQEQAFVKDAFTKTNSRLRQIEELQREINATKDAKSIGEIQARIGTENAQLQVEATKIHLYQMQSVNDDKQRVQASLERDTRAMFESRSTSMMDRGLPALHF